MNIIPDLTLTLVQMAPFLVLLVGLQFILYKPMISYLEARDVATAGARKEAQALQGQASDALARLEAETQRARNEIADFRAARRHAAHQEYQAVLAKARAEAEAHIAAESARIRDEANAARAGIGAAARTLSDDVATKVLGRPIQPQMEA